MPATYSPRVLPLGIQAEDQACQTLLGERLTEHVCVMQAGTIDWKLEIPQKKKKRQYFPRGIDY